MRFQSKPTKIQVLCDYLIPETASAEEGEDEA